MSMNTGTVRVYKTLCVCMCVLRYEEFLSFVGLRKGNGFFVSSYTKKPRSNILRNILLY